MPQWVTTAINCKYPESKDESCWYLYSSAVLLSSNDFSSVKEGETETV